MLSVDILSGSGIADFILVGQKIGYDKAAACAKKAHKEGTTLKARPQFLCCAGFCS